MADELTVTAGLTSRSTNIELDYVVSLTLDETPTAFTFQEQITISSTALQPTAGMGGTYHLYRNIGASNIKAFAGDGSAATDELCLMAPEDVMLLPAVYDVWFQRVTTDSRLLIVVIQ